MTDDYCGPARRLDAAYTLEAPKQIKTFFDASPGSPPPVRQIVPHTGTPVGGQHVASLRVVPLQPATNPPSKNWKPPGRR